MVEFCTICGASIPYRDIDVVEGEEFTSPDYVCPTCGSFSAGNPGGPPMDAEPDEYRDVVIRDGKEYVEPSQPNG